MQPDIFVIGGGPAGLAIAIAARLKGFDVAVADGALPPIDKACGEGLLPAGVDVLHRLGVQVSKDDGFPFRGIRFLSDGISIEANFKSDAEWGCAGRDFIGIDRASELGVRLLWGTYVADASELSACRWIVGADGQKSHVRHTSGLAPRARNPCASDFGDITGFRHGAISSKYTGGRVAGYTSHRGGKMRSRLLCYREIAIFVWILP